MGSISSPVLSGSISDISSSISLASPLLGVMVVKISDFYCGTGAIHAWPTVLMLPAVVL